MTTKDALRKAEAIGNWPANIKQHEKDLYIRYQAECFFFDYHNINQDWSEQNKDAKHRIIANCLSRV